jgi:hypothetical protein
MTVANGRDDGWESFDFDAWGSVDGTRGDGAGRRGAEDVGTNGRDDAVGGPGAEGAGEGVGEGVEADGEARWVSQGGVLHWEGPGDDAAAPRAEVNSRWADEDVELPLGVPDAARIRSAHAWLVRRRALEGEAQGMLLLERRVTEQRRTQDLEEEAEWQSRRGPQGDSPLDVALAEHQAALEEYEHLIEALDEIVDHSGPARALVEYYLVLTERWAELAQAPGAPAELAQQLLPVPLEGDESAATAAQRPVSPREEAEWRGRAEAVVQARRRVERVSAPEPED